MDDFETGMSEDLGSILDNEKLMEGQTNQRLKDFFKKLIQTDAQIRKLKQAINNNYQIDNLKAITDRFKRSVPRIKRKHRFRSKFGKTTVTMHTKKNTTKENKVNTKKADKRSIVENGVPVTGYVIESKEVVIQYDADKKRNIPKCSHSHEDKYHEKNLNHPDYKHSQRIDEMLETYKIPGATTENFDVLYDVTDSLKTKPDNYKDDEERLIESITKTAKPKTDDKNDHLKTKTESNDRKNSKINNYERKDEGKQQYRRFNVESDDLSQNRHHHLTTTTTTSTTTVDDMTDKTSDTSSDFDYSMENFMSTAPMYDLALSVSTFINPMSRNVLRSKSPRTQHLGQRNLLQVDEEDEEKEELAYDDLKEVLADDKEGHDDMDRHGERKKRDYEEKIGIPQDFNQNKHSPQNIINPNWKGPMPLYPDELNAMIKQAALQNLFNLHVPVNTRDSKVKRNVGENANAMSDTQYVEDYSDKKYNKLAKMAQAYSDYGVLYKKDNFYDKSKKYPYMKRFNKLFSRQKPSGIYEKGYKPSGMNKKDSTRASEGFKFELRQGSPSNRKEFSEGFQKHIKLSGNCHETHNTTLSPTSVVNYEYDTLFTPINLLDTTAEVLKTTNPDRCLILTFKKGGGLRTLKTIDIAYEDNDINEAIALNLDEVNDTKEILNLTNLNMTNEEDNEINSINLFEDDDKMNATNLDNLSEDGDIITETLALNLTKKNNIEMIKNPILMKLYKVNNTRNGTNAQNLPNNDIINVDSSNFIIRKSLRTLKFIDIIDDAIIDRIIKKSAVNLTKTNVTSNNDNSSTNEEQVNKTIGGSSTTNLNEKINGPTQNLTKRNTTTANNFNNTTDGIISFISMMSDWFRTIASLSGETDNEDLKKESKGNNNSISNLTTSRTKNKYLEDSMTKDILYPSYDVEMVANIGHRSRVLLSFDKSTEQDGLVKKQTSKINYEKAVKVSEIDDTLPIALVLASNDTTKTKKTVNKRTLDENLVFWNDLYDDDEYGVKLDYMDNVRDKHSVKKVKNILHKSRDWLADKCSDVKNKLRRKPKTTRIHATTDSMAKLLKKTSKDTLTPPVVIKEKQRFVRSSDNNENKYIKKRFAALTANMKKVCQEAARAIQDTRNIKVRENSQENEAASSLMQNLVRMMSDLVDIQVQQKTCAKLPSDLYNFLEWLTAPNDDKVQVDEWPPVAYDYNEAVRFGKSTEPNDEYPSTLTEDSHQDDRTECLGTIRAVQDLIQQYEGMTDEDKSKMTGVKEYLENQLLFLNNKLNNLYDPNPFKLYEKRELERKRRDTISKKQDGRKEAIANIDKTVKSSN